MSKKTVIVIAGPTAVGKTAMAIQVAQHLDTEIISADSRQCYKELNIGVARPSVQELATVPHHFIASHSIHHKVTAATFEQYALKKAAKIFEKKDTLVMVGGTGLYIRALEEGLDDIPDIPPEIRAQIVNEYEEKGLIWLQETVQKHDPLFYEMGEIKNTHRLMRALEVYRTTGQSIVQYKKGEKKKRPYQFLKLALHLPKEILQQHINFRVDAMINEGLEHEVQELLPYQELQALQTVGYQEMFAYFKGNLSGAAAIEQIKIHTRQYAKRQLTWFKKDKSYKWFEPAEQKSLLACIDAEKS